MEYINPCPTLRKLPRNLLEIANSPELTAIVNSDQFINELSDAMSALAFPHFGFRGWKEDYTGYSPVWNLANALSLWAKKIEEITDWGLTALLKQPKDQEILWFSYEYVRMDCNKHFKMPPHNVNGYAYYIRFKYKDFNSKIKIPVFSIGIFYFCIFWYPYLLFNVYTGRTSPLALFEKQPLSRFITLRRRLYRFYGYYYIPAD